jgi:hypothetical protein
MANLVNGKTVELDLVGLDGNAFSLMGAFSRAARQQGWSKEEIDIVLNECKNGDYDHLLCTLSDHTVAPDEDEAEDWDDEDDWDEDDEEDDE